jgi:tetratricopeptide (TPR) repeat protein
MGVSYGDNYLEDVIESGKRVRWATRHGDLKLYIEQRPTGVRGFEAGYPNLVMQAMQAWLKSLSGQLNVTTTTDPAEAHIRVTWTAQFREGDRQSEGPHREYLAGWTRPVIQNEQLRRMEVQLATLDPQGQPHPAATIYLTALHELGHALGLRGHSPHPEDVMATVPRQQGQRTALSLRDVRTIRRLYDEPADITQLPPGQSLAQRTRPSLANQRQQESILDQQIAAMARQAQQKAPNAWFHLGGLYTSKANLFPEGSNQQKLWLEKATEAFTYSSQTDFRPSLAYANRALLNERMGQPGHALRDMATAIRLSPKEADFYLQQARMLIKAGQPAEARNALSTFLLYEPAGRSDPTYQRLSKHLAQ